MTSGDGLTVSAILGTWAILNLYGEWYWRTGRGAARKLRKKTKRI